MGLQQPSKSLDHYTLFYSHVPVLSGNCPSSLPKYSKLFEAECYYVFIKLVDNSNYAANHFALFHAKLVS